MLGVVLKNKREELGMTLQDVSRMTGMPTKYVSALENERLEEFIGGSKEIERMTKLYARKLNIPVDSDLLSKLSKSKLTELMPSTEVVIPLFLLVSPQDKKTKSKSPR
ncbi:MAG: helix-turn-helix domain-containing protein [Burkholderiaceae bacterium]|jgi:cytoskeletal protein RodZ|nr:helix-turn-helix domain-containing protein [Polynucleobacter sp.]